MNAVDKEFFRKWVAKAEEDLLAARKLLQDESVLASVVCFHCQQGAEKYLKAVMALHGKAAPTRQPALPCQATYGLRCGRPLPGRSF